ncbi:hypothetical protein SISSUDRAFT_247906 [Sistotremastrum suecicum HHB10207 ss-3]|uniref:MYND-type domain-containing protein n=1 Tax=Sistotremastrum suecicum HHB10207 ss-3 TaxID=1314776 RepID=A0A165ZXJ2_9AGAM|nr:hypothetical protein SISSUDRAFT_247906 [Sistotremastrum suecicum HHB10207 ss-3]
MRAAAIDFFNHRQKAQKQWAPMIESLGKYKEVTDENQRANKFKGLTYEEKDLTPERKPDKDLVNEQIPSAIPEPPKAEGTTHREDQFLTDIPTKEPRCTWCHRHSMGLKKCANCGEAKYCNKECQSRHWKLSHKRECVSPEINV